MYSWSRQTLWSWIDDKICIMPTLADIWKARIGLQSVHKEEALFVDGFVVIVLLRDENNILPI